MSEQKVLIDCRDAALGYEGRPIWEHLTFQVRRGDYLCIVGDNGSGKSTLLKSMLGLLRPLSGEIRLDESLRRGAIGYLPQQTRAQKDFPATVSEVVLSGFLSARGWKFFYTPAQKSAGPAAHGQAGHSGAEGQVLSGAVRRPAAAGAAGPGPVRGRGPAGAGRTGDGPGPRRRTTTCTAPCAISTAPRAWPW